MDELIELLKSLVRGVDFEHCETLIDDKFLSSLEILTIVSEVEDEFDITFPASELVPANFNSVKSLWALIQKLQK